MCPAGTNAPTIEKRQILLNKAEINIFLWTPEGMGRSRQILNETEDILIHKASSTNLDETIKIDCLVQYFVECYE